MTPDEKRAYNAAWVRRKRAEDPEFRQRELEAVQRYRATPAAKAAHVERMRAHRARLKAERNNP